MLREQPQQSQAFCPLSHPSSTAWNRHEATSMTTRDRRKMEREITGAWAPMAPESGPRGPAQPLAGQSSQTSPGTHTVRGPPAQPRLGRAPLDAPKPSASLGQPSGKAREHTLLQLCVQRLTGSPSVLLLRSPKHIRASLRAAVRVTAYKSHAHTPDF